MIDATNKVNTLTFENLSKMSDPHRTKYNQFVEIIKTCSNFKDSTGKEWGAVDSWGTDKALVIDSLSGLSDMAMQLVAGGKAVRQMQDWMVAQNTLEFFINKCVTDLNCWFVMTAHIEREKDEITGAMSVMVSTLGRKLAPKIPKYFSDVILFHREADKFYWSTAGSNIAVKSRNLPLSDKLAPSFLPLVNEWKKRGGVIAPPVS
jgi:hypothetical protein